MTIAEGHCPARSRLNRGNLENPNVSCAKTWRCPGAVWPMRRRGLPNRCGGKSTAIGGLRRTKTARGRCYNRPGLHWPVWCVIVDYTHQFLHHWNFIGVFVCRLHPRPWSLDRDYRVSGGPHVVRAKGGVSGLPETTIDINWSQRPDRSGVCGGQIPRWLTTTNESATTNHTLPQAQTGA